MWTCLTPWPLTERSEPYKIEVYKHGRDIGLYSFSEDFPVEISDNTIAIFHVRRKGDPRTLSFNNMPPKDLREWPCDNCKDGELVHTGGPDPSGTTTYTCNSCYAEVRFP